MGDMAMGGKRISIVISDEQFSTLERMAEAQGLRATAFAKSELVKMVLANGAADGNRKKVLLDVTNYRELSDYMECKKFGSIGSFATFAMEQYMTKYPAKARKKDEQ